MAKIMLVDNDERLLELTTWCLERAGHEVVSVLSYAAAREALVGGQPDLLLADLELGLERGVEELPKMAQAGILPPTLVLSGFLDSELNEALLVIPGVLGTLAKPVGIDELVQRVDEALATSVLQQGAELPAERDLPGQPAPAHPAPGGYESAVATVTHTCTDDSDTDDDKDGWVEILPVGHPSDPEGDS